MKDIEESNETKTQPIWQIFPLTVTGSMHINQNKENQDSYGFELYDDYMILVVADGHGSKKAPLSKIGSQLAVDTFLQVVKHFLQNHKEEDNPAFLTNFKDYLTKSVVRTWRNKIDERYKQLEEYLKPNENKYALFGTTLAGAIVMYNKYTVYFQLGDSNISVLNNHGFEPVFADKSERGLLSTETHSFSSSNAQTLVNIEINHGVSKSLILYTDSIDDSADDEDALKQMLEFLYNESIKKQSEIVYSQTGFLIEYLNKISEYGVGDDTTVLIASQM